MTEEKPPKIRGKKEREAAYRQGFADGLAHGVFELKNQRDAEGRREAAMVQGIEHLNAAPLTKRTRRTRAEIAHDRQMARDEP